MIDGTTRITPAQILPDEGALYRDRRTGELVRPWGSANGLILHVDREDGSWRWMHWDEFWRTYIHASARE